MSKNVSAALSIFETIDAIMNVNSNFEFKGAFKQQRTRGIYLCTNKGEYGSVMRLFIKPEHHSFTGEVQVRIINDDGIKLIVNDTHIPAQHWHISELTIPSLVGKRRIYRNEGLAASLVNYANNTEYATAYPLIPAHFAFFAELIGSASQLREIEEPEDNERDHEDYELRTNDGDDDDEVEEDPNETARSYWTHSIRSRRLPVKSVNVYEILGIFPTHFYLDIDKLDPRDMEETIHQIVDIIQLLYVTEFQYVIDVDDEIKILRSFPDKVVDDVAKCSFHIIVKTDITFGSIEELGNIVKTYFKDIPYVDKVVYNFLQKMRIPGSTKTNNDRRCFQPVKRKDLSTPIPLTEESIQEYLIQVPRPRLEHELQKPLLAVLQKISPTTVEKVLPDAEWEQLKANLTTLVEAHPTRNWTKSMLLYLVSKIKSVEDSVRGYELSRYLIDISNEATKQSVINLDNRPEQKFNKMSIPNRINYLWKKAVIEETTIDNIIEKFTAFFIHDNTVESGNSVIVRCNSTFFSEERHIRYNASKLSVLPTNINSTVLVYTPIERTMTQVRCTSSTRDWTRYWRTHGGPVMIHVEHQIRYNTPTNRPIIMVTVNGNSKRIGTSKWNEYIAGDETMTFEFITTGEEQNIRLPTLTSELTEQPIDESALSSEEDGHDESSEDED